MTPRHVFTFAGLAAVAVGGAADSIAGVSWGSERIDLFGVNSKGDVYHKYYTAFGWGPDDPAHGNLELFTKANASGPVSVTSWGANRLDFAFVGADGDVKHKYWDGSSWGPNGMDGFDSFGGEEYHGKAAISSWGANRFDIVAKSVDDEYHHKAWTGDSYWPSNPKHWTNLSGEFVSDPATVSWGHNRLDIFGITPDGTIAHKYWDGSQWSPVPDWEALGGTNLTGTPIASSMAPERWDIWAISSPTGALHHRFRNQWYFSDWESLGGNFTSAPAVTHWADNRIDLLGLDADGHYQYKYWDGHQWNGWYDKGTSSGDGKGSWASQPALVSTREGNLNLFGVDDAGKLCLQVWDGSQWLPGPQAWYQLGDATVKGSSKEVEVGNGDAEQVVLGSGGVRIELKV